MGAKHVFATGGHVRAPTSPVLDTFFGGDVSAFLARRRRHLSFRVLTRRPDLPFEPHELYRAVRLVEQQQEIPDVLTDQLGYSQQLALLPVRDLGAKLRLAERAVAEDWTVRQRTRRRSCSRSSTRA